MKFGLILNLAGFSVLNTNKAKKREMQKFRINALKSAAYVQIKRTDKWRSLKNEQMKTKLFTSIDEAKEHLNKNFIVKEFELKKIHETDKNK